ncbi:3850_t:CDS:2 [Entrophospora sp. SA101]|nr:3850_t:CDS:2 [Entrophospora sp. SA101]
MPTENKLGSGSQWGNGLALTGFAYLVIFDAMGIFTIFISTVLITYRSLREPTIKNPFGVQRYEILFGFINILYLLFVALYILKEGLEHLLLETSEEHYDHNQHLGWLDKVVSIIESMLMFYLACPIATSLGKILLQTTPDSISMYLEDYLREVKKNKDVKEQGLPQIPEYAEDSSNSIATRYERGELVY